MVQKEPKVEKAFEETFEEVAVETPPVVKQPKRKEPTREIINDWVIKDRIYLLKDGSTPLTFSIRANNIYYFDKEKGYELSLIHI